jgi:hypothetical protein
MSYETDHEEEQAVQVDPSLGVSMMLAQTELLRLETDIALAAFRPVEEDESVIHDLSPLGR